MIKQLQTEETTEIFEKVRELVDEVNSLKDLNTEAEVLDNVYLSDSSSVVDIVEAINTIIDVLKGRI